MLVLDALGERAVPQAHARNLPNEKTRAVWWNVALLHWLFLLGAALVVTPVLWTPALLAGHSAWHDLVRMVEFDAAFRSGELVPGWSPDLYYGFGSPLFQFYSPLVYFVAELPHRAGLDIASALKLTHAAMLLGSGIAMYHLAAAHVSRWAACFAGLLYMVAPYRFVDLFVRHASAEHAAFLWLPLIVLGTQRRQSAGVILAVLGTAGLVLTHNVMALAALPFCVAAGWWLRGGKWSLNAISQVTAPAIIGVGLAAFFWWPALSGRVFTHAEQSLTQGYFDYRQHFVALRDFVDVSWGFGETGAGTTEKMPLQVGLPHLFVALAGAGLLTAKWRTPWTVAAVAIVVIATLMCHAFSAPVWATLPLLKYVQFPWRFLALVVFGTAMCGAALLDRLRASKPQLQLPVFCIASVGLLAAYFPYYSSAYFLAADSERNALQRVTPDEVALMQARGVLLAVDRIVTPSTVRAVGERATSSDDFLPRDVVEKPTSPAREMVSSATGAITSQERVGRNRYRADV